MTTKIIVEAPAEKDALVRVISDIDTDEGTRVPAGTSNTFYIWKTDHSLIVTETERQFDDVTARWVKNEILDKLDKLKAVLEESHSQRLEGYLMIVETVEQLVKRCPIPPLSKIKEYR